MMDNVPADVMIAVARHPDRFEAELARWQAERAELMRIRRETELAREELRVAEAAFRAEEAEARTEIATEKRDLLAQRAKFDAEQARARAALDADIEDHRRREAATQARMEELEQIARDIASRLAAMLPRAARGKTGRA